MVLLNVVECYGLKDRGVVVFGYKVDFILLDDLIDIFVVYVY